MSKFKTVKFYAKCSDLFNATLTDDEENEVEYNGYPFTFLGDSNAIRLEIDLDTGQILNWKTPTDEDFEEELEK